MWRRDAKNTASAVQGSPGGFSPKNETRSPSMRQSSRRGPIAVSFSQALLPSISSHFEEALWLGRASKALGATMPDGGSVPRALATGIEQQEP
jgi:hypothetical protein